jgi:nitrogen-specific signal transduction histidine kinase
MQTDLSATCSGHLNHGLFFYSSLEELQNYLAMELPAAEYFMATEFVFAVKNQKIENLKRWASAMELPLENLEFIDAEKMAKEIHVNGKYQPQVFQEKIGSFVRHLAHAGKSPWIFGEIVDVLCEQGFPGVADQLERDWNTLLEEEKFYLLCGYRRSNFSQVGVDSQFDRVCEGHNKHLSLVCGSVPLEKMGLLKIEQDNFLLRDQKKQEAENAFFLEMGRIHQDFLHELKNVLLISNVNLERIQKLEEFVHEAGKEKFQKAMGGLLSAQNRLNQTVQEGCDLSRFQDDTWVSVNLADLVKKVVTLLEDSLEREKIKLEFSAASLLVNGNPALLERVLFNLLEFSKQSFRDLDIERNRKIVINIHQKNSQAEIEIIDNGKGIKSEHLPYIFRPFYTTKMKMGGAGFGLAYCKKILSSHAGDLLCESNENVGTSIRLVLPLKEQN